MWTLLLVACSSSGILSAPTQPGPEVVEDSGPTENGEGSDGGAGEAPAEEPGESIGDGPPPSPWPTAPEPLLCSIALQCPAGIADEPKSACTLLIVRGDADSAAEYSGPAGVELRGRSSFAAPKPPLSIELRDETGEDAPTDLFGMGAEADWVLNGMYFDRALLRNKLAYDAFRAFGPNNWAPQSVYCTLSINDTPYGLYTLIERVKWDDDRIAIDPDGESGRAFVAKLQDADFLYNNWLGYGGWKIVSPSQESLSTEARATLTTFFDGWYGALSSSSPDDPDSGIFAYIDLDSAVDMVILEELFKNNDAWYLSVHIYKAADGKLHFVPWDLDLSLGQPSYNDNENPHSWVLYRPDWIARMGRVPAFKERLVSRWAELRAGPLTDGNLEAAMSHFQSTMTAEAIEENFRLFPIETIQFGGSYLYAVSSYEEEDARVRAWIAARTLWMDENIDEW